MSQADSCGDIAAEDGTTPYAHYPTETRFRRPDYKFYRTLDDSAEFAQRVQQQLPPPVAVAPPPRRPMTAHPTGAGSSRGFRGCPHRQRPEDRSTWREPEPGWRPIYPEPDLSTPRRRPGTAPVDRRTSKPTDDEAAPSSAVAAAADDRTAEAEAAVAANVAEPQPPMPTTPSAAVAAAATPLAVVDFLDGTSLRPSMEQPQPQRQPPPPQTPAAARFFRPKTAPGRVDTAGGGLSGNGGLQILGRGLQPAERATSAKATTSKTKTIPGGVGVRQLSDAYDRALDVHGWRMEVPGDPCGIKRELIPKRKSINLAVPEPSVKPLPPRMRRTNRFTFFHTTAPRVVMSFDIHPSFTSEQYAKAKAALARQGKWDFRYRDFSFIY